METSVPTYDENLRAVADSLAAVHDHVLERARVLVFHIRERGWHDIYACGLYATMIELAGACVALARSRALIGVTVLMRSLLEAYIDLVNLLSNSSYIHDLEFVRSEEFKKFLEAAVETNNDYLQHISADPGVGQMLEEARQAHEAARASGGQKLGARRRFELAGMPEVYPAIYATLCTESHNNGRALLRRHVDTSRDPPELVLYDREPSFVIPSLLQAAGLLLDATTKIHERYGRGDPQLGDLETRHRQLNDRLEAADSTG